jgi:hypothetical protein
LVWVPRSSVLPFTCTSRLPPLPTGAFGAGMQLWLVVMIWGSDIGSWGVVSKESLGGGGGDLSVDTSEMEDGVGGIEGVSQMETWVVVMIVVNVVSFFSYMQFSFIVLSQVGVLTHAVCNAMRRPAIIATSVIYFQNEINLLVRGEWWFPCVVCLLPLCPAHIITSSPHSPSLPLPFPSPSPSPSHSHSPSLPLAPPLPLALALRLRLRLPSYLSPPFRCPPFTFDSLSS